MEKEDVDKGNVDKGNVEQGNVEQENVEKLNDQQENVEKGNVDKGNSDKGNDENEKVDIVEVDKTVEKNDTIGKEIVKEGNNYKPIATQTPPPPPPMNYTMAKPLYLTQDESTTTAYEAYEEDTTPTYSSKTTM